MRFRIVLAGIVLGVSAWLAAPVVFGAAPSGGGVCCDTSHDPCPRGEVCVVSQSNDSCSPNAPGECVPDGN